MRETAASWLKRLAQKEIKPQELLKLTWSRMEEQEPLIAAFLEKTEDLAEKTALTSMSIPIALKDNLAIKGVKTTCGSKMLQGFVSPYTATVVERLQARGIPIVGKTNMDEFAMGSSCEHSAFFPTRNPWDIERVPGGSSGGSAAAVASGEVPWALGSDTGGSIRQPAAFCGVVGLKPTYGLVSRYGLVAFASSLDQIGPITQTVEDAAILLSWIAGHDVRDTTSIPQPAEDYCSSLGQEVKGMKVAVLKEMLGEGLEEGVRQRVEEALHQLESLGVVVEETSFPLVQESLSAYYILAPAECSSNLARYDGMLLGWRATRDDAHETMVATRDRGFGPEVKRRIMIGTYCLSSGYYDAYYRKAQKVRALVLRAFEERFKKYDFLLSPTAPTVAFPLGSKLSDPLAMYASDICTIPASLAGICAISVPCGLDGELPVGIQFMGRANDEKRLLQMAYAYEEARGPFPHPSPKSKAS